MLTIRKHPKFEEFFDRIVEQKVKAAILARITRLAMGNAGDHAAVGNGVWELRIHLGAGWRVYYATIGERVIPLLGVGSKKNQQADICAAIALLDRFRRKQDHFPPEGGQLMKPARNHEAAGDAFELDKVDALPAFDPADYLQSEEAIAAYLNDFLEEGDSAMIAEALGAAARAKGMTEVAKQTGMAREALYKALRPESSPRFDTILRVMKAFGLRLVAEQIRQPAPAGERAGEITPSDA